MKKVDKFDVFVFLLIFSLCFGIFGGSLQIIRLLGLLLLPVFIRNFQYKRKDLLIFVIIFCFFEIYCFISLLWTPDYNEGLKELIYYPIHFLIFLEILLFSRLSANSYNMISLSWLISVILTLFIAFWEITTGNHLPLSKFEDGDITLNTGVETITRQFAAVSFGNFNGYVKFLCFALPFVFYQLFRKTGNRAMKFISILTIFFSYLVIIINASRGGFLAIVIMTILYFILSPSSVSKYAIIVIFVLFGTYLFSQYGEMFLTIVAKAGEGGLTSDDSRIKIWTTSILILFSTLGFGTGVAGMTEALKSYAITPPKTHNLFIEILLQYGCVFFLLFLLYIVRIYFKARNNENIEFRYVIYIALLSLPFSSIIDSGYLLDPITFVFFASLSSYGSPHPIRCVK